MQVASVLTEDAVLDFCFKRKTNMASPIKTLASFTLHLPLLAYEMEDAEKMPETRQQDARLLLGYSGKEGCGKWAFWWKMQC